MKNWKVIVPVVAAIVAVIIILFVTVRANDHATFKYPGGELDVLIADNPIEHQKGLSGTEVETLGADGMLFIFNEKQERTFWMKGMNYPLDIAWIGDGKILKVERNIPAPEDGEDPVYMYSRPFEVDMVLELPHGYLDFYGLYPGHIISVER